MASRPSRYWVSAASYWQPPRFVLTAWTEHAPFASWLMEALRPAAVVELGSHYGYSYYVFAEAVARLGLNSRVFALDSWEGDDQAGFYGDEVYESVRSVTEREYAGIGSLIRGYFEESRRHFTDGSVDLLHIDGRHGYDDVKQDFEAWVSTVRPGGIVLFHDISEHDRDFGVWRLWDEISDQYPSFSFAHGHGLGVLGVGDGHPHRIASLLSSSAEEGGAIRAFYEERGASVARQAALELMPAEVESLHDVVADLSAERVRLTDVIAERDATLARIYGSRSWRMGTPVRAAGAALRRQRD